MREFPRLWVPPPAMQFWLYNKTNDFLSRGNSASSSHVMSTSSTLISSLPVAIVPYSNLIFLSILEMLRNHFSAENAAFLAKFSCTWESGVSCPIRPRKNTPLTPLLQNK